jgi:predicted RNA-binding protein with PIN domain
VAAHYLLVDGYNIIFAHEKLSAIAGWSLDAARKSLCDSLCEFKALSHYQIIAVFDAHKVEGGVGSVSAYFTITVVFTREAETADHYIEKAAHHLVKRDKVTVATSDALEQIIIIGSGARRISAADLWEAMELAKKSMHEKYNRTRPIKRNPIASLLDEETARKLDEMRYGEKKH